MNHFLKTLIVLCLSPLIRLIWPVAELVKRLRAYVMLASRTVGHAVDPSIVILGPADIEGTCRLNLGRNLMLYPGLYFETRGSAVIEIGDDVVISRGTHLVAHSGIKIGAGSMIGEYSSIRDGNHRRDASGAIRDTGHDSAPISIGKFVWIGRGVMILPGVTIGDRATVGANAVVTRDVPAGVLVAGVPAKIISKKGAEEDRVLASAERSS